MTIQQLILEIKSYGLTQSQIAQKLNVSQNSIWQYEHGKVNDARNKTYQSALELKKLLCKKSA